MKWKIQSKKWIGSAVVAMAAGVILFSFQNCGKAGFDSTSELSLSEDAFDAANIQKYGPAAADKLKTMPFSFQSGFDQISVMSCSANSIALSPDIFYTFKGGSYRTNGLSVKQESLDYINSNFTPIDQGRKTFTTDEIKAYLADAFINNNATSSLTVRNTRDITSVKSSVQDINGNVRTYPSVLMNSSITDPSMMERILNVGYKENFFRLLSTTTKRTFEAQLNLGTPTPNNGSGNGTAGAFFDDMINDNALVALSFKPGTATTDTQLMNGTSTSAEGVGYHLRFDQARAAASKFSNPYVILNGVGEANLNTPNSASESAWNCSGLVASSVRSAPIPFIYQVVSTDFAKTNCLPEKKSEMARYADPNYAGVLALARKNLTAKDWDVNIHVDAATAGTSSCAIPRNASCYPDKSTVDYTLTKSCFDPLRQVCTHSNAAPPIKDASLKTQDEKDCDMYQCSQFVSMCIR